MREEILHRRCIHWVTRKNDFPCLYMVASVVFGMLPGSGGLECDIGGFKRVITPQRAQLSPGFVEALLMLNLNSTLFEYDIRQIKDLGAGWEQAIPQRPAYPASYIEDESDDDENREKSGNASQSDNEDNDDASSDSSNIDN